MRALDLSVTDLEGSLRDRGIRLLEIRLDRDGFSLLLRKDTYQHGVAFERDVALDELIAWSTRLLSSKGAS